jgi:hypothetical protein
MSDSPPKRRVPVGELIAFAALIVSALGVWIAWKSSTSNQPTRVVEQRQPIPLTLRGRVEDEGRTLIIAPVEQGHAMESLNLFVVRAYPIELGSEGRLRAEFVESKLPDKDLEKGQHSIRVGTTVHYVEMGKDRTSHDDYMLHYRVESGGLLGGRSLRLTGLSRG